MEKGFCHRTEQVENRSGYSIPGCYGAAVSYHGIHNGYRNTAVVKYIKRNFVYLIGMLSIGVSTIALIYMQSEFTKDYLLKFMLGVIGVAIATTLVQILAMWMVKLQKKGPVFFINRSEDERFIFDVRHKLQKGGCVCYPTSDLMLHNVKETLTAQIKASRLIVVLLTPGYDDSPYMRELLKIVKKEKKKNILFFTCDDYIPMPQSFKQSVPLPLEGRDTDAEAMENIIFKQLTKF